MESASLILFAVGALFLLGLGTVTLFFGITANSSRDFPFHRVRWLRAATGLALLAVAPAWFYLAPSIGARVVLVSLFTLAAILILVPRRRRNP